MLRAIFVILIILFGGLASLTSSFHGLLFYLWIAYFRPETWLWDASLLQALSLSLVVGVWTLVITFLYGVRLRFGIRVWLLVLMLALSTISTFASPYSKWAIPYWEDFVKIIVMTYLISVLLTDERRLRLTIGVIGLSLGFEAAKQGLVQLVLAPGVKNINSTTMLGDENLTAVGMFMLVPMLMVLGQSSKVKWHAWIWRLMTLGVAYRGISTYSRGGLLACAAMTLMLIWRSQHRVRTFALIALVAMLIVPVLPTQYWARMSTMNGKVVNEQGVEEEEGSAVSRLYFWGVAMKMANAAPLTGIGHNAFPAAFDQFDASGGEWGFGRAVHSSWFGLLAEIGYPGLTVFVLLILATWISSRRTRKRVRQLKNGGYLIQYATALECSLVAFVVGGTFVTFQYNEMIWHLFGLSMALDSIVRGRLEQEAHEAEPQAEIPQEWAVA